MPAKPLTDEQKEDAARLKQRFKAWQDAQKDAGRAVSQEEAAERLGFGQSALSQYLNAKIPLNISALTKFVGLLGCTPADISPSLSKELSRLAGVAAQELDEMLQVPENAEAPRYLVREPETSYYRPKNQRMVMVVGRTQGGMPARVWDDAGFPVGATDEYAEVSSMDEHAFVCRVVGDSMVPRYHPGEYALVEPGTVPDIEDDVLVRLTSGETMLKRLLSRRGGIRLGSYNESQPPLNFREDEITWMYYVAHPIPSRKIKQRIESEAYAGPDRRTKSTAVPYERRLHGDQSQPSDRLLGGSSQFGELVDFDEAKQRGGKR